jgi:hypothetical protein
MQLLHELSRSWLILVDRSASVGDRVTDLSQVVGANASRNAHPVRQDPER